MAELQVIQGKNSFEISKAGALRKERYFYVGKDSLEVGTNDNSLDVKFWGDSDGAYMYWDSSTNTLSFIGDAGLSVASSSSITVTDEDAFTITVTDTAGGNEALVINNTFTKVGVIAHKAINVGLTYTPASAGTACPIGVAGKVSLNGDLTAANSYPGLGWGVQGQIHMVTGSTIDGSTYGSPGAVYAGLRGVVTDAGTSTYTKGNLCAVYAEIQMAQQTVNDGANFNVYGVWIRNQGGATSTEMAAGLYIDSNTVTGDGANILKGIQIAAGGGSMTTGISIEEATTTGISISGTSTTGISISGTQTTAIGIGTSAVPLVCTTGTPLVSIYSTSSNTTSTNTEPFYFKSVMTGVNGYGGRAVFHAYTNVAMQTNLQAIRAYVEYGVAGYIKGNSAALNAEIKMPNADISSVGGAFNVLKLEYTAGGTTTKTAGGLNGNHATWMRLNTSGDADGDFDDNGYFAVVTGLTAGASHLLSANSSTLRVGIGTTAKYLFLSGAEDSIDIGACTKGINFSGTIGTAGIDFGSSTVTMAANRTNSFIRIGNYAATRAPIVISDLTQTFAPMQMHFDIQATGSGAQSFRPLWCWTEVSTADQSDLSIYGFMHYIELQKDISDAYGCLHQIVVSSDADASIAGRELHAVQGTLEVDTGKTITNSGSYAHTAINASLKGAGTFASGTYGIGSRMEGTVTAGGMAILSAGPGSTVDTALKISLASTSTCPYLMTVTDPDTQVFDSSSSATADATLKIDVNGTPYYILLSTSS